MFDVDDEIKEKRVLPTVGPGSYNLSLVTRKKEPAYS